MGDYKRTSLQVPPRLTSWPSYGRQNRMNVLAPGKPPRLRFKPGQFLEVEGLLWEIVFAFRLKEEPFEWFYSLEERASLQTVQPADTLGHMLVSMGAGEGTPRVVYEMFHNEMDAWQYFSDIPAMSGYRKTFRNKTLIQKGKIVSSGEVLK